jgi:hypothetical protein
MKTLTGLTAALMLAVLLAACGGGGGGGGKNAPADGAALADIELSAGALDQVFQPGQFDYTSTVGYLATMTTVTPTTVDAAATVTVNGVTVLSGSASDPIPLMVGANTITLIVTAADGVTTDTYTVTVTRESANQFAQRAYIKASNTDSGDNFGYSVALSGGTLAVGATGEASNATGINGDQGNTSQPDAGAVYVFTRNGTTWTQQAYVKASNTDSGDNFGYSVALSSDTLAVGATGEASDGSSQFNNNLSAAGAAYVFIRNGTAWTQQAYIKASNPPPASDDNFGWSLALRGDTLGVGVPGQDSNTGAGYLFARNSGTWSQLAFFKASNPGTNDVFGWSLALTDDMLAVGAPGEDSGATGIDGNQNDTSMVNAGAVYTFQ